MEHPETSRNHPKPPELSGNHQTPHIFIAKPPETTHHFQKFNWDQPNNILKNTLSSIRPDLVPILKNALISMKTDTMKN